MYHVPLFVKCIYGWSNEVVEYGNGKERSKITRLWKRVEIAWPLCGESEEDLRVMVGRFDRRSM